MNKIAFLFLVTNEIQRKDYWDSFFVKKKSNIYFHNDKMQIENYGFHNENILTSPQKTKWGFILEAIFKLLSTAYENKENEYFVICSESCIPVISFELFYDNLFYKKKSFIEIWNMDKFSYSKVSKINKEHIKHSAFWILKRSMVSKLLEKKEVILKNYNFESGEEYFLSYFYHKYKNDFIVKRTTYTNWNYNKDKIKKLYAKKKIVRTDKEYLKIKRRISELGSHPKSYIDIIPSQISSQNTFFARKFFLSRKEFYLKDFSINNIIIISGLQRSGNHLFIKLLIESLDKKVVFINDFKKKNKPNINLFNGLIFDGHYLSKNINNLIELKDLEKKKIDYLVISTEEYFIDEIEKLYNYFGKTKTKIKKVFIMRDLLNLTASRLEFMKNFERGYPMYTDQMFINNWLDYFNYTKREDIITLNYNEFMIKKDSYIIKKFEKLDIVYKHKHKQDIKITHTLFGKGSSFSKKNTNYLERYKLFKNHKTIKKILKNKDIKRILKEHFFIFDIMKIN